MPRLRHRLRCRRGGSRHRRSPSPSSPSHSSRSPSENIPCQLRSSGQYRRFPPSPQPDVPTSFQPAEPRPVTVALIQNPSTAIFHYQCNSARPLVIATVNVSFKEIPKASPAPSPSLLPDISQASPSALPVSQHVDKGTPRRTGDCCSSLLQVAGTQAGEREAGEAATQSAQVPSDDEKDCWCRIVEESPSGDYGL